MRRLDQLTPALLDSFLASRPRTVSAQASTIFLASSPGSLEWAVAQEMLEVSPGAPGAAPTSDFGVCAVPVRRRPGPAVARCSSCLALQRTCGLPSAGQCIARSSLFAMGWDCGPGEGTGGLRLGDLDTEPATCSSSWAASSTRAASCRSVRASPRLVRTSSSFVATPTGSPPRGTVLHLGWWTIVSIPAPQAQFHHLVPRSGFSVPEGLSTPGCTISGTRLRSAACCAGIAKGSIRRSAPSAVHLHGPRRPASTAVYLTITPALLDEANRRFEAFAAPAGGGAR